MSNMSYCRFRNTLRDLEDCHHHIENYKELSSEEFDALHEMLQLCSTIAQWAHENRHELDDYDGPTEDEEE